MRETKQVTIGTTQYRIKHLTNGAARKVLRRVLAAAAPLASLQHVGMDVGSAIQRAMASIDDADLDAITALFAAETSVVTSESGGVAHSLADMIDEHFAGPALKHYLEWLKACMDHNFAGFFADLRAQVAGAAEDGEAAPKSPSTSTGGSTE